MCQCESCAVQVDTWNSDRDDMSESLPCHELLLSAPPPPKIYISTLFNVRIMPERCQKELLLSDSHVVTDRHMLESKGDMGAPSGGFTFICA